MNQIVQIKHLRDFTKCPAFSKYSWDVPEKTKKERTRLIIESCYRDLALSNKVVNWKTIRNRIHHLLSKSDLSADAMYRSAVATMEGLRGWYIEKLRDFEGSAVLNMKLETSIGELKLEAAVDLLIEENDVTLIVFTDVNRPEQFMRDIGIRTKIYLLSKENIKVTKLLVFKCAEQNIKYWNVAINKMNFRTEEALKVILYSIQNNIFYPSPTSMCQTCKFKNTCGW